MKKNKTVLIVFGTRPEAIKLCPLIIEIKKREDINCLVCVTGQHREMLKQVLEVFRIEPDYNLDIMKKEQTLGMITCDTIKGFDELLQEIKPDIVLVHGDTTTAFAAAVAAFYHKIPIGHVEAGLRTNNIYSPYPEEFNRQAIDLISTYYFAPTKAAAENLLNEGKDKSSIFITGNTVIDAMKYTVQSDYYHEELDWAKDSKLIFMTAHRRENIGENMHEMFSGIKRILDEFPNCKVIYPIHLNPKVRKIAKEEFGGCDRIHIIEPLNVVDCHNFESRCHICLTDSGGIQEECPSYGKPVLVMRNTTERPEAIEVGCAKLVGTSGSKIYNTVKELLINDEEYKQMSNKKSPFGDGKACERIIDVIVNGVCKEFSLEK